MKMRSIGKKTLVLSIVAIVAFSMVGMAAVHQYLSNEVKAEVTVEQAMELKISKDGTNWQSDNEITFNDVHGGEEINFFFNTLNHANKPVEGYPGIIVTCDEGFGWDGDTLLDFEQVFADTIGDSIPGWDITGDYEKINNNKVKFSYGPTPPISFPAGYDQIDKVTVEFADTAYGHYTATIVIAPSE